MARAKARRFNLITMSNRKINRILLKNRVGNKEYLTDGRFRSNKRNLLEQNLIILRKLKRIRLTVKVFYDLVHPAKIALDKWLIYRYELNQLLENMIPFLYTGFFGTEIRWSLSENKVLKRFARISF